MKAIEVDNPGRQYELVLGEIEQPKPKAEEILIKVAAAGVNRADLLQAQGRYPPPPGAPSTLGMEVSGEVVETGEDANGFQPGQKVCALLSSGGYAEYAVAPCRCVLPAPAAMALTHAAALPEALFTVWSNLFDRAHLRPGETVLVHGGASGIGTTAIQLCAALGCTVFATAGSAEKCSVCVSLGAACAINYHNDDYVQIVREATGGRGADVILDMVGGDYIGRNFEAAAMWGRIVNIAFQSGSSATVNFAPMLQKRLTFSASTLRSRTVAEKGAIRDALLENVWPLIEAGKVKPVIDSTFPLREAASAHARMGSGAHIGKLLLTA